MPYAKEVGDETIKAKLQKSKSNLFESEGLDFFEDVEEEA